MKSSNNKIREKIFILCFCMYWISELFNGYCAKLCNGKGQIVITFILLVILLVTQIKFKLCVNYKWIIYYLFMLFLSSIYLLYSLTTTSNFSRNKIISNYIISNIELIMYVVICILIYKRYIHSYAFYSAIKKLVLISTLFELFLLCIYIQFNDYLSSIICVVSMDGRFKGSFSEPSVLGFFWGLGIILVPYIYKKWWAFAISTIQTWALYTYCGAKFAILALPISLIIAYLLLKIKTTYHLQNFVVIIFLLVMFIISVANFNITNIFAKFLSSVHDFNFVESFSTRFSFIIATIKNLYNYPFGVGVGNNLIYFQNEFQEINSVLIDYGIDNFEIPLYLNTGSNFYTKETFSYIGSAFGYIGIAIYLKLYFKLCKYSKGVKFKNCSYLKITVITFVMLESIFTINVFQTAILPFLLSVYTIIISKEQLVINLYEMRK